MNGRSIIFVFAAVFIMLSAPMIATRDTVAEDTSVTMDYYTPTPIWLRSTYGHGPSPI